MDGELLIGYEVVVQKIECLAEDRGTDVEKLFQFFHLVFRVLRTVLRKWSNRSRFGR
jgi:hypothetical protein